MRLSRHDLKKREQINEYLNERIIGRGDPQQNRQLKQLRKMIEAKRKSPPMVPISGQLIFVAKKENDCRDEQLKITHFLLLKKLMSKRLSMLLC